MITIHGSFIKCLLKVFKGIHLLSNKYNKLVDICLNFFEKIYVLDIDDKRFLDNMFSLSIVNENFINFLSNSELETLVQYFMFPDYDIQIKIEPILNESNFNNNDELNIVTMITNKNILYKIQLSENIIISIPVSNDSIITFINRLNIANNYPLNIKEIIEKKFLIDVSNLLKIKLRNSRFKWSDTNIDFFFKFIDILSTHDEFIKYFDFICEFLTEFDDNDSILNVLTAKKNKLLLAIDRKKNYDRLLINKNIEMLTLSGNKCPFINEKDALEKIKTIDEILFHIFNII